MITGNNSNGDMTWADFMTRVVIRRAGSQGVKFNPKLSDAPPLLAYINHGRWLADCECKGAELVFDEGLLVCLSCFNKAHGYQPRRVAFPEERLAIEALLERRPLENQNWRPGESLAQLQAENDAHKEVLV